MFDYDLDHRDEAEEDERRYREGFLEKEFGEDWKKDIEGLCPECGGCGCDECYMTKGI